MSQIHWLHLMGFSLGETKEKSYFAVMQRFYVGSGSRNNNIKTGESRRVLIPFVRYGRPKKFAQILFLQHF